MLLIREFRESDLKGVVPLVAKSLPERYEPSLYLNLHRNWPEGALVAEDMGRIVGYMLATKPVPDEARLLILAVDDMNRNRGVGTSMLRAFINNCTMNGLKRIHLEVRVGNKTAIRFYGRFGFTITDLIPNYYNDGESGYRMEIRM